ncbi:MAG: hypothetical protein ACQEWG_03160 [Bacteroidota bacterium]
MSFEIIVLYKYKTEKNGKIDLGGYKKNKSQEGLLSLLPNW